MMSLRKAHFLVMVRSRLTNTGKLPRNFSFVCSGRSLTESTKYPSLADLDAEMLRRIAARDENRTWSPSGSARCPNRLTCAKSILLLFGLSTVDRLHLLFGNSSTLSAMSLKYVVVVYTSVTSKVEISVAIKSLLEIKYDMA